MGEGHSGLWEPGSGARTGSCGSGSSGARVAGCRVQSAGRAVFSTRVEGCGIVDRVPAKTPPPQHDVISSSLLVFLVMEHLTQRFPK